MKSITYIVLLPVVISTLAHVCSSCGSPRPDIPVPDVASESVKAAAQERQAAWDSVPPSKEEREWVNDNIERKNKSEFKSMGDAELEGQLRKWMGAYRTSCDTVIYNRFKDALKDGIYQGWGNKNKALMKDLKKGFLALQDSCKGGVGEGY